MLCPIPWPSARLRRMPHHVRHKNAWSKSCADRHLPPLRSLALSSAMSIPGNTRPSRVLPSSQAFSENLNPNVVTLSTPRRKPFVAKKSSSSSSSSSSGAAAKLAKGRKTDRKTPVRSSARKGKRPFANKSGSGKVHQDLDPERCDDLSAPPLAGITALVDDESPAQAESGGKASAERDLEGSGRMRKMRRRILEEAMSSVPAQGAGRVMYLVKTFERLLSISKESGGAETGEGDESKGKVKNWALPGLQFAPKARVTDDSFSPVSSSSGFSPAYVDIEMCSPEQSFAVHSSGSRLSYGSNESDGSGRKGRNSASSSLRSWDKKLKVTRQKPFKLRTEQRGRFKEAHFINKVHKMILEEEKKRIPIAQGLPWTTDEPECLVIPPARQPTEPIGIVLHSDVRAIERAEFDLHVAERMSFVEQIKLERERQQKFEEEEEIRRLRRELVPRAQPMPYFDHPFMPRKSTKPRTVPKEPKFHGRLLKDQQ